jgi:hypothetical protein
VFIDVGVPSPLTLASEAVAPARPEPERSGGVDPARDGAGGAIGGDGTDSGDRCRPRLYKMVSPGRQHEDGVLVEGRVDWADG